MMRTYHNSYHQPEKKKKAQITNVGEDKEKREPLFATERNVS